MKYKKLVAFAILSLVSSVASADLCSIGRVAEVSEGFGEREDLLVKIDYTVAGALPPVAEKVQLPDALDENRTFWLKFNADNTSADRLKRVRTLVYLALANGNTVKLSSKWSGEFSCQNLHQIVIVSNSLDSNT